MSALKSQHIYLQEMSSFLRDLEHMTPVQRFARTQEALLDMQKIVSVHKSMREKSDAEAESYRKYALDQEAEASRLKVENLRLRRGVEMRDAANAREKATTHALKEELVAVKQVAFDRGQQEAVFRRKIKQLEDDVSSLAADRSRLQSAVASLQQQLEMKDEALRKEQLVLNQTRNARNEAEKKVKELEKEVRVTRMVEEKAWSNASDARKKLLDGLDEALMMNPNHFSDFDLAQHHDRRVVVASAGKRR